jgi:hypothetical protein
MIGPAKRKIKFPPYGNFPANHFARSENRAPVPDWLPADPNRQELWVKFFDQTLKLFNQTLWPRYDRVDGKWDTSGGHVTEEFMNRLTWVDLQIMNRMEQEHPARGLDELPQPVNLSFTSGLHRIWFGEEDGQTTGIRLGTNFPLYDRKSDSDVVASAVLTVDSSLRRKDIAPAASVGLQFKAELQRPRPYQTSFLFGLDGFVNEAANTADTPSMISGHTQQGLIAAAGLYERMLNENRTISPESLDSLRQYGVDVGDRRVMAGVHYPSDNLASWILFMRIADFVFRTNVDAIKREFWHAIEKQSLVYHFISTSHEKCYEEGLKVLRDSVTTRVSLD